MVVAQVTENVHDVVTGDVVLISQGSRLIGAMTVSSPSGRSALLIWQRIRILMPDDSSIESDSLLAPDTAGYAGLEDEGRFPHLAIHQGRCARDLTPCRDRIKPW
ncbi:TrbI/VirB10 family protein [Mesorhizobium retamae]|uniref:ATPase n=1 Tax=Mesorhizobium retamae TaxID=2912854 RepID=A0ABS9QBU5_9HYPH|nr:TrbI/VirB10 family protein [Mesorhizobium sp. IRAMC:0171]MCG7504886.1 hypothetical protein [Mesorhizobium sp. IRAMC:0171]